MILRRFAQEHKCLGSTSVFSSFPLLLRLSSFSSSLSFIRPSVLLSLLIFTSSSSSSSSSSYVPEISWLEAVARVQARTSAALVRREQHKRFHQWVLSASNPRAPRGTDIGKLHRHVNSPNVTRSLSTEGSVLRSTPSAVMEVREAHRIRLVALRNQALAEDIHLLEPVSVHKMDKTTRRIPDNFGLGSDCVQPGAIKHAPVFSKLEFCRILDSVMRG